MKKLLFISIIFALLISAHVSLAQTKLIVPIPIEGGIKEISNPGDYISYIYLFGLSIGGLLGMAIIVYAAIERIVSAGNASKISDANDRITQAAIGLLLLFGAYVILRAIDPRLTTLTLPTLKKVEVPASANKSFADTVLSALEQNKKEQEQLQKDLAAKEAAKIAAEEKYKAEQTVQNEIKQYEAQLAYGQNLLTQLEKQRDQISIEAQYNQTLLNSAKTKLAEAVRNKAAQSEIDRLKGIVANYEKAENDNQQRYLEANQKLAEQNLKNEAIQKALAQAKAKL